LKVLKNPTILRFVHAAAAFLNARDYEWWKIQKKRNIIVNCHQNLFRFPSSPSSFSIITSVFILWFR